MQNLSFETGAGGAGTAIAWVVTTLATPLVFADYGNTSLETFEAGWDNAVYLTAFTPDDLVSAQYSADVLGTPSLSDGFEAGWDNAVYYTDSFPITAGDPDNFETGWQNDNWTDILGSGDAPILSAFYQAPPGAAVSREAFEQGWKGNQDYATTMPAITSVLFDGVRASIAETFGYRAPVAVSSVNVGTDYLTAPGAALGASYRVRFPTPSFGATLPSPLSPGALYYVRDLNGAGTDTFRLSGYAGLLPVMDLGSTGSGYFEIAQPAEFWTSLVP